MKLVDLVQALELHTWRIRFAFFPVQRIELVDKWVKHNGYYFWRIVVEVKVGLVPSWTAYAHMNDGLVLEAGK